MPRLGIEMLSTFGLPPLEQVALAGELGVAHISTGLHQMPARYNPFSYPEWSLKDDAALRRAMRAAMRDAGVAISLGEGFAVRAGVTMRDRGGEMDIMAELGARGLGAVSMEQDAARAEDELAILAEMAGERGMLATLEFAPAQVVKTLGEAAAIVARVNRPNFGLLVDAMHFFRSGGQVAQLAETGAARVMYAQLCDVPREPQVADYLDEAMNMRLAPGAGELPLADFIRALPADIPIGLEVPNLAAARDRGVRAVLADAVAAAVSLLDEGA